MRLKPTMLLSAVRLAGLAALATACGSNDVSQPAGATPASGAQDDDAAAEQPLVRDEQRTPPREYYEAALARRLADLDQQSLALLGGPHLLWINFDGATVSQGYGDGESFIPCGNTAKIPASGLSPADRQQVVAWVNEFFAKAGANLSASAARPAGGAFTTMHTGGVYSDLGCSGGRGILGVAPFDVGNANDADVGFAFLPAGLPLRTLAETIAHEAGHSYGLEHVENAQDLMHASATSSVVGFKASRINGSTRIQDAPKILQDTLGTMVGSGAAPVATVPVNPALPAAPAIPGLPNLPGSLAGLPGLGQIAGLGQLLPGLAGATGGTGVLDISSLLPQLQSLIPAVAGIGGPAVGMAFPGLDQILTLAGLASQAGSGGVAGLPFNPGAAGGVLTTLLGSVAGGGTGGIAGMPLDLNALLGMAGYGNMGSAVGGLQGLLSGFLGGTMPLPGIPSPGTATPGTPVPTLPTAVPDLSALLGLVGSGGNIGSLLNNLSSTAAVVNGNFGGATQSGLLSLLSVAYSQAFGSMAGVLP